jgi:hypothetical protein
MFKLSKVETLLLSMYSRERKDKTSCNRYGGVHISKEDKGIKNEEYVFVSSLIGTITQGSDF